jgi:hypothetical protein
MTSSFAKTYISTDNAIYTDLVGSAKYENFSEMLQNIK